MTRLLFFTIVLCSTFGFSQEIWNYLPIEITNNYHGAICPIDENTVHVVSDYGKFYKTVDGGESWLQFDSGVNEFFFDLTFDGPDNGYAVGDNGKILKTSNAGQTWATINSGTTEALVAISVNAPNSIWTVGDNGTVLHSTDGGNSWVLDSSLATENLNDIKFRDENIGYIAGDNGILLYTENGGNDWEELPIPSTNDLFGISLIGDFIYIVAGDATTFYSEYGYSGDQLYKSNNNIDWDFYSTNPMEYGPADIFFTSENLGYSINSARTVSGRCFVVIEKTTNSGEIWVDNYTEENASGICHSNPGFAKINFPTVDVGYVLLGRFILKTPYETVGIEDFNKDNAFTIYPNPTANGKFNLKFDVSDLEGISIEIVDVNGRLLFAHTDLKKDNNISIPVISEGIHFVKVLKNGKMMTAKKLLKQ
ncbi:YCF48-related protein [Aequorivita viscosa]|nr:YCF48-related protein [Aequorivita viscosa]